MNIGNLLCFLIKSCSDVHVDFVLCVHLLISLLSLYLAGYEQFHLFRSDPALCFKALVGEEPPGNRKKKKVKPVTLKLKGEEDDEFEELDLSGEDTDDESAPSTPGLSIRLTNNRKYDPLQYSPS